ncbi:MAG TPA: MarR family transcriptional regulator [Myxococcales bacterium]|nr:MarR family transcriptional regulator [Myxococcales bacterium]
MRNISSTVHLAQEVARLKDMLIALGRRRSLRDPVAAACEKMELTAPQIHALSWLRLGPLTMGDLARMLGITEKTATGVIDRLEREGYVARSRDRKDRRVVQVQLARRGRATADRLDQLITDKLGRLLAALDPVSRRHLFRILEQLLENLPDLA